MALPRPRLSRGPPSGRSQLKPSWLVVGSRLQLRRIRRPKGHAIRACALGPPQSLKGATVYREGKSSSTAAPEAPAGRCEPSRSRVQQGGCWLGSNRSSGAVKGRQPPPVPA